MKQTIIIMDSELNKDFTRVQKVYSRYFKKLTIPEKKLTMKLLFEAGKYMERLM